MSTAKDSTALKVEYKSPLNINEAQVARAIEIMQSKAMPNDFAAEQAVLGAILQTQNADASTDNSTIASILKVRSMLAPKDFYNEKHQAIYAAVAELMDNRRKIDFITVSDQLLKMGKLEEAGGAFYLVECTNRVGSSVHAIDHASIVIEMSLRRSAILSNHLANTRLFDPAANVWDIRNELADDLRVMPVTSFLRVRTANQRLEDGRNMPKVLNMCGGLWKAGELVFLFAGPKRGKSIFAVQIADAIARGEGLFPTGRNEDGSTNYTLTNELGPQRIGYVDFELQDNEFFQRYSDKRTEAGYEFTENLIFVDINPDFNDYTTGLDKVIFQAIEDAVLSQKLDALVIDNITWLAQVATSDTQAALELMRKLDQLKKRMGISILILAHSPKINAILPLDENMMGGSKHLSNFAQGVFAIGKSAIGSDIRYIKECVRRNGQLHFDDDNVIQVAIDQKNGFLQYDFMSLTPEAIHLNDPNSADVKLDFVKEGAQMRKTTPKSFQAIYDEMNIKHSIGWSCKQFTRKVKEELERSGASLMFLEDAPSADRVDAPFKYEKDVVVDGKVYEMSSAPLSQDALAAIKNKNVQVTGKGDVNEDIPF